MTLRRPERNSDLVVFVDTFSESSYRRAIAGAVALVSAYGALRDRVGVVTFGGTLSWVSPAIGVRHLHRLVAQLLSSVPHASYVWRDLSVLPIRSLPPGCMVLALSPLDDERSRSALLDLAARGVDLAVVELASARRSPSQDPASAISLRLWGLRRWERRQQFQRLGVAVARWEQEQPLSFPIDELVMFRRRARAGR